MLVMAEVSYRWGRLLYFAAAPGFHFSAGCTDPRQALWVCLDIDRRVPPF
jgi:hypothetical protein